VIPTTPIPARHLFQTVKAITLAATVGQLEDT
jgi:hypothetical protein